ncbi:MAG: flavin reductase family protein [Sulfolobales archaeon]|nr:flavin reductase family protein [Sulfolobales archaeon]MDW7969696.1 flavin reductase family protein [Sulfolobales archaeon]
MFQEYDLTTFYRLLHPRPVAVITSTCGEGKVNAMACSWFTPVSEEPPTIAVVVDESSYTAECIELMGEFALNILPSELLNKIWVAGSRSGRNVDKIRAMDVNLIKCSKINSYAISESIAYIEVSKVVSYGIGGSKVFFGEVVAAYVKDDVAGNYGWKLDKVSIPLHDWGRKFYVLDKNAKYTYIRDVRS